jgi:hypothetical protein
MRRLLGKANAKKTENSRIVIAAAGQTLRNFVTRIKPHFERAERRGCSYTYECGDHVNTDILVCAELLVVPSLSICKLLSVAKCWSYNFYLFKNITLKPSMCSPCIMNSWTGLPCTSYYATETHILMSNSWHKSQRISSLQWTTACVYVTRMTRNRIIMRHLHEQRRMYKIWIHEQIYRLFKKGVSITKFIYRRIRWESDLEQ